MIISALLKPTGTDFVKWDGTNKDQIQSFLTNNYGSTPEVVQENDGTLSLNFPSPYPDKYPEMAYTRTVTAGAWIETHGSVYTPTELNARYYLYPNYALPDPDAAGTE